MDIHLNCDHLASISVTKPSPTSSDSFFLIKPTLMHLSPASSQTLRTVLPWTTNCTSQFITRQPQCIGPLVIAAVSEACLEILSGQLHAGVRAQHDTTAYIWRRM